MSRGLLLLLLALATLPALAQERELSGAVPEVELVRNPTDSTWVKPVAPHSTQAAQAVQSFTPAFVKSYSPGSLATISVRGGTASQTAIVWEGVSINNPMLGQTDLSTLGSGWQVRLRQETTASLPLGAVAGAVELREAEDSTWFTLHGGQYGRGGFAMHARARHPQDSAAVSFFMSIGGAENNFRVKGKAPWDRLPNASSEGANLRLHAHSYWPWGLLSISFWVQDMRRGLPPTLLAPQTKDSQQVDAYRLVLALQRRVGRAIHRYQLAWLRDGMVYEIPGQLRAPSVSQRFGAQHFYTLPLRRWVTYQAQSQIWNERAMSTSYVRYQARLSHVSSLACHYRGWHANGLAGLEALIPSKSPAPSLQAQAGYNWRRWDMTATAAWLGRNPTLNDRYWQPGGNPNAQPEQTRKYSLALQYLPAGATLTAFDTYTHHALVWLPSSAGYWQVDNLSALHNRGIELQVSRDLRLGSVTLSVRPLLQLLQSQQQVTLGTQTLERWPLYQSPWQVKAPFTVSHRRWYVLVEPQGWGRTYVTTDNSTSLPEVWLLNAQIGYNSKWFGLWLRADNLFDYNYQIIAWRPMPGRWISGGVTVFRSVFR